MSWAFLETMKRDFNWNVSYIQVSISRTKGHWTGLYTHIAWLVATKYTGTAARALLPDTAIVVRLSI